MLLKLFFLTLTFLSSAAYSQSSEELFGNALKNYQEGRFQEAKEQFEQVLNQQPNNFSLLYNLGLTEYRLGNLGPAIALWRRALNINRSLPDAEAALQLALNKLERKSLSQQVSFLERFRSALLVDITHNQTIGFFALVFLVTGWVLIAYFGSRKQALQNETPLPPFKFIYAVLVLAFLFSTSLLTLKTWDHFTPRGTVLPKKVEVRAGPGTTFTALFDLYEGLEVIIDESESEWTKVIYPGGRSGWVPRSTILQTTGKALK